MMVLWISDQAKQMCHHCLWSLRDEKQQRQEKHEKIKTQFTWPLCLKKPNYTDLKEQWNKGRNVIPKWWTIRSRIYFKKWRTWTKWQPSGNNTHFRVCKQCPEGPEFTAHYSSLFLYTSRDTSANFTLTEWFWKRSCVNICCTTSLLNH